MTSLALVFALAVTGQLEAAQTIGQLTGSVGTVSISRDSGGTRGATAAAPLQAGDTVSTGPGAVASILLRVGTAVYVAGQSQLGFTTPATGPQLFLSQGEIRVVISKANELTILTSAVEARMSAGILRCRIVPAGIRFRAEKGAVRLRSREEQASRQRRSTRRFVNFVQDQPAADAWLTLKEGQQVLYVLGKGFGNPTAGTVEDWTIDPDQIMIAIGQAGLQDLASRSADTTAAPAETESPAGATSSRPDLQSSTTAGVNFTLGNTLTSTSAGSAGGLFTDANQNTLSGRLTTGFGGLSTGDPFAGNIHLVAGETAYSFRDVVLAPSDPFVTGTEFWSIGTGASPTTQITTGIGTGTMPKPDVIRIPSFEAYLVRLDQFGIVDPASSAAVGKQNLAATGLVGSVPFNPEILGATPLLDDRGGRNQINPRATFALGELSVAQENGRPRIAMRRSDQDRKIVKDANGDDNQDQVTPNADVTQFNDVADPRFYPQNRSVKVPATGPNALSNLPTYSNSTLLRRAAFTALTAERLKNFAQRTGQTRFVIDGQIVDITGYERP